MPRNSNKKGGAFAYAKLFDYPLSPCYKPMDKAPIPKMGWHAGGASSEACDSQPSVAKMGVIDTPLSTKPSASEIAWDARYSCPGGKTIQDGGRKKKILNKLNSELKKKSNVISIDANKGGKQKVINVVNMNDKYVVSVIDKASNKSHFFEESSADKVSKKINGYDLLKINKSKKV